MLISMIIVIGVLAVNSDTRCVKPTPHAVCNLECELPPIVPDKCPYETCVPATEDLLLISVKDCKGVFACNFAMHFGLMAPNHSIYTGHLVECNQDGHKYLYKDVTDRNITGLNTFIVDGFFAFCGYD